MEEKQDNQIRLLDTYQLTVNNIIVEIITSLSLLLSLFSHELLLFLLNKIVNISTFVEGRLMLCQ